MKRNKKVSFLSIKTKEILKEKLKKFTHLTDQMSPIIALTNISIWLIKILLTQGHPPWAIFKINLSHLFKEILADLNLLELWELKPHNLCQREGKLDKDTKEIFKTKVSHRRIEKKINNFCQVSNQKAEIKQSKYQK